ncbi:FlgB family protein [Roseobacter sp. CCS2]|uniref:FlgB family protein n=1 Tax=Roseobacter sp. CCS2 TaxID=391593 RepID=UPI0000F403E0|nr:FlgB family protein [Roseobacter sp. CCS2]EBA13832.1 flagellar basal-body rod protein FlgB, putative [Roseobacter sp. CCS2]
MYNSLDLFQTAGAMARHAGTRQAVVARNIANADTPDFQAQAIAPFKDVYQDNGGAMMRATRPSHISGADAQPNIRMQQATVGDPSPNGNTVSIEDEMLHSVDVAREHSRALMVYRHAMTVLRTSLGRS